MHASHRRAARSPGDHKPSRTNARTLALPPRPAALPPCLGAPRRYSAPFREQVQAWIVKLSTVSEIIEQWLMVQNMWMYMEAVFSGGDIVKQLPAEAKRFQNIDKNYMKARAYDSTAQHACCTQSCCASVHACSCVALLLTPLCHVPPSASPATDRDVCDRVAKRGRHVRGQRADEEHAAAPAGAAGAVPEEPQRLPGDKARRVPAVRARRGAAVLLRAFVICLRAALMHCCCAAHRARSRFAAPMRDCMRTRLAAWRAPDTHPHRLLTLPLPL